MTKHAYCGSELGCPCWEAGARAEAQMHRSRLATRELTDWIRALGDADPVMPIGRIVARLVAVFGVEEDSDD